MKYLETPCLRCNAATVRKPEKRGTKWMAFCTSCKRWNGVKRWKVGDEWCFTLYRIGKIGMGLAPKYVYLELWMCKLTSDEIRNYISAGKLVIDKRLNF